MGSHQWHVPQIGQFVKVLRGRDTAKYSIIITIIDHRFVMIADGDKRKFDQPKKKNVAHLELLPGASTEVIESIRETGRVSNGKLRFALGRFVDHRQTSAQEKGE